MTLPLYVLDTDTVTFQQAGRPLVIQRLASLAPDAVFTTIVTMREQLRGRLATVDQATTADELVYAYDRLLHTVRYFARVNVLPFTMAAAAIVKDLQKQRIRIGTQDLRIAAIVLATQGTLVTANSKDFARVPGLQIEDWTR
jgi:tRNA(fMet)-specific endonuclease VapC